MVGVDAISDAAGKFLSSFFFAANIWLFFGVMSMKQAPTVGPGHPYFVKDTAYTLEVSDRTKFHIISYRTNTEIRVAVCLMHRQVYSQSCWANILKENHQWDSHFQSPCMLFLPWSNLYVRLWCSKFEGKVYSPINGKGFQLNNISKM